VLTQADKKIISKITTHKNLTERRILLGPLKTKAFILCVFLHKAAFLYKAAT